MASHQWILPQGIEELLPQQTRQLEAVRQQLMALFESWGYEQVITPLVEYLDSLLTGSGAELDLQTFKLIDQQSGRLLGIRADMTPQVARIDAHRLHHDYPTRLWYIGTVLRTVPREHGGSRTPHQVGAELYGDEGIYSDIEVIRLMVEALQVAGIRQEAITLDIGHVAIYQTLLQQLNLSSGDESQLQLLLARKARHEVCAFGEQRALSPAQIEQLAQLCDLYGDRSVLERARALFAHRYPVIDAALDSLQQVVEALTTLMGVQIHIDLAELRGYRYHNGLLFAAYLSRTGQAIAQGGRYDGIGEVFGRRRAATGFSLDLKQLLSWGLTPTPPARPCIAAPAGLDPILQAAIARFRQQGYRVVQALDERENWIQALGATQYLSHQHGEWQLQSLESSLCSGAPEPLNG